MTVQLTLPREVEERLMAEVRSGRHPSLEAAILEKLSRSGEDDDLLITGMDRDELRRDLDAAWSDRRGAVDGVQVFHDIAAKMNPNQTDAESLRKRLANLHRFEAV